MKCEATEIDGTMYTASDVAGCSNKAEMAAVLLAASLRDYYSRERRERCARFAGLVIKSMTDAAERDRAEALHFYCRHLAAGWSPAQMLARVS